MQALEERRGRRGTLAYENAMPLHSNSLPLWLSAQHLYKIGLVNTVMEPWEAHGASPFPDSLGHQKKRRHESRRKASREEGDRWEWEMTRDNEGWLKYITYMYTNATNEIHY